MKSPRLSSLKRRAKTAFLFPGSGAQHLGMGRDLRAVIPAVEKHLRSINQDLGYDIASAMNGPKDLLFPPVDSPTPTIFMEVTMALSLAVARSLRDRGVNPEVAAGRSMGEYSSACFSGAFSTKDCFRMVSYVTRKGQQDCLDDPSFLVSIYGLTREELLSAAGKMAEAGEFFEIVAFYDKARLGVAGLRQDGLPRLKAALSPFRHRISLSKEVGAFHTTLFNRLTRRARAFLRGIDFTVPLRPLYMNLDAARETSPAGLKSKLAAALNHPVLWQETINNMLADGVRTFVELAPGAMLTEFICDLPPDAQVLRTDTPRNYRRTLARLTGK